MLEGRLVRLRRPEIDDAERYYRWLNDQDVVGNLIAQRYPISLDWEKQFLRELQPMGPEGGILAIDTRDGRHIGMTSFYDVRMEDRKAALAITIGEKACWSQGYGTDAVETMLRFAFGEMNLNRVWLTTVEYNERAIACYRKCGFQEEARLREHAYRHGRYWDFVQMAVLRTEFEEEEAERSA
jgi:RimJ/RimL family protein N-acetyltransferase